MTVSSFYSEIPKSTIDPIMVIMDKYHQDNNPKKADLSIGVYKPEDGNIKYVFPSVKSAKEQIYKHDEGHPYHQMSGLPSFVKGAKETVFGSEIASSDRISSIQTISGTGAVHVGVEFVTSLGMKEFYVGTPTWGNYVPMIETLGGKVNTFSHYDAKTGGVDMESVLSTIDSMPDGSIILLQACCHNPTGADYSKEQWIQICEKLKSRKIFTFFDNAYQGFASGDKDEDAWAIRYFFEQNMEFLVCESFSKNMGLYGERVGCLHVVSNDGSYRENITSLLVSLFRAECSFAPLFGARIASHLFTTYKEQWDLDVKEVANRMATLRAKILAKFQKLGTPGNWDTVVKQNGLFWFSGLTETHAKELMEDYHIYFLGNGRFNVAGFNENNLDYIIESIDKVVRKSV